MKTRLSKNTVNIKSRAVAWRTTQSGLPIPSAAYFADNRPDFAAQRKLKGIANDIPGINPEFPFPSLALKNSLPNLTYNSNSIQRVVASSDVESEADTSGLPLKWDVIDTLKGKIERIWSIPDILHIPRDPQIFQDEFAKFLSFDKEKNEANWEKYRQQAANLINENNCTAFTNHKSEAWFSEDEPDLSYIVHELVHVLSSNKGHSKTQIKFGRYWDEGFTQYFTGRVCERMKIEVRSAYENETRHTQSLVKIYGERIIHDAHFNGEIEYLLDQMLTNYLNFIKTTDKLPFSEQKYKKDSLDEPEINELKDIITSKLRGIREQHAVSWLNLRGIL